MQISMDRRLTFARNGSYCLRIVLTTLAVLILWPAFSATGQILDSMRGDVRSSSGGNSSHHWDDDEDDEESLVGAIAAGFFEALFDDDDHHHHHHHHGRHNRNDISYEVTTENSFNDGCFQRYPYFETDGFMVIAPDVPGQPYSSSTRLRFEYGDDFADMARIGARLLHEGQSRFGVDASVDWLNEEQGVTGSDQLRLGDFNFTFRFWQTEYTQMRMGLGFNWLKDEVDSNFGWNFTIGGDFYIGDPWVISSTLDLGALGGADLLHFRITAGVVLRGVEIYTGYDVYSVGQADVHGFVGGLRFWF
jgi:hypothetical protein